MVLLTGSTGFIGRRIQKCFLEAQIPVRVIVRPGSRHHHHVDSRCEIYTGELCDQDVLRSALKNVCKLVYCAGTVKGRSLNDFLPANLHGIQSIVSAINQHKPKIPTLLISSLAATRPEISDYAKSKFLGEESLRHELSSPWSILRPPAVYGPGDTELALLFKLASKGLIVRPGPKDQRLSFIHADDLAAAVLAWIKNWQTCVGQTFNIDDGRESGYGWTDIAEAARKGRFLTLPVPKYLLNGVARTNLLLSRLLAYAPMLTPGKSRELSQTTWLCDNTAFEKASGWQPQIDLAQGIRLSME